jgi:hypothetical protein
MEKTFTKLSALVDDTFTVLKSDGYTFKKWDNEQRKMLTSDQWQEGYKKTYTLETDKGILDVGSGQLGNLLEAVFYNGEAKMIGTTYEVKSNGKTGMEIRYFFNVKKQDIQEHPKDEPQDEVPETIEDDIDLSSIPF